MKDCRGIKGPDLRSRVLSVYSVQISGEYQFAQEPKVTFIPPLLGGHKGVFMRYSPIDIETKMETHDLGYLVTISFTLNEFHEVRIKSIGTYITLHVDGREIMNTTAKMLKAQEFHYTIEEVRVDFNLTITAAIVGALPSLSVGGVMVYNPFA